MVKTQKPRYCPLCGGPTRYWRPKQGICSPCYYYWDEMSYGRVAMMQRHPKISFGEWRN